MTVEARLTCGGVCRTIPLTQYDQGQMIHLNGIALPASYLAEFANSESDTAEQIAQTTDTVTVPDKYLISGNPVYVWIVVVGEDERTTRYEIIVPVRGRGEPDDYTPTPEEQTAIEAAIAALNSAVEAAGVAIEHYPKITDGVWQVWDVTAGEWISTEVPAQGPQGETGATGNGIASAVLNADYTLTLTFTNGTTYTTPSIRGAQGAQGDPGPAGQDGADGYSPTATVSKSGNTATITITDKDGTTTAQVSDGATGQTGPAGADGYSPTASVSKSGSTATITITDKQGTTTATVSDGAPGAGVPSGGTAGQVLSKASGTDYDTEWTTINPVVTVSGTTPAITALPGVRYICGEVSTLAVTVPASGCVDIVFESGSTPTVLTVTSAKSGVTAIKWANGFDPSSLDANTTYEVNILDGEFGVACAWT